MIFMNIYDGRILEISMCGEGYEFTGQQTSGWFGNSAYTNEELFFIGFI